MDPHALVGEIGDYTLKLLQMEHREQFRLGLGTNQLIAAVH